MTTWTFVDAVLEQIDAEVVAHPPERGGALLGPRGLPIVSHFVLDVEASTTSVLYLPSTHISRIVAAMEAPGTLELKGILHSHPGLDQLSGQDERSFAEVLAANPRMPSCLAPIATQRSARADHDMEVPHGKVSVYEVARTRTGTAVHAADAVTLPAMAVARRVAAALGVAPSEVRLFGPATGMGAPTVDVFVPGTSAGDLVLGFPLGFPAVAPIVVRVPRPGAASYVPVVWHPGVSPVRQVVDGTLRAAGRKVRSGHRRPRRGSRAAV